MTHPPRDFSRFNSFLDKLADEVYPELPSDLHTSITAAAIAGLQREGILKLGQKILDIGCGQGVALKVFRELGMSAVGITLGPDAEICRSQGFDVREMDQNFMTFTDGEFDLLWCRHVLEHSVAPLFTLSEYLRVTKPGGYVYIELPAPDTSAHHELNTNHYSMLPSSAWMSLFQRLGFIVAHQSEMKMELGCGPDVYWLFLLRTPA